MIHQVAGDILLSHAHVIAHGVAPNDPMKQGLALQLREKYPAMHKDFHHWCNTTHPKPGEAWMWGGTGGVRIVNLLTQDGGYGHGARPGKASIRNVRESLRAFAHMVDAERFSSVALPRLATGVGELEWKEVWPVVQERLGDLTIPIFVYVEYHAGQRAEEPGR